MNLSCKSNYIYQTLNLLFSTSILFLSALIVFNIFNGNATSYSTATALLSLGIINIIKAMKIQKNIKYKVYFKALMGSGLLAVAVGVFTLILNKYINYVLLNYNEALINFF